MKQDIKQLHEKSACKLQLKMKILKDLVINYSKITRLLEN
jgi:hypothetical protein